MTSFIERLGATHRPLVWLDATAYAGRLLAQGQVPWLNAAEYIAWQRKTQALLHSDVISVPLMLLSAAWVHAHDELRAAMAAKRRTTYAVKALLGDEDLRAHVAALVKDLRSTFPEQTLALVLPTPGVWVAEAYGLAHEERPEVDDDEAESAAVYIADFLRLFADSRVDALLLQNTQSLRLDDPSYDPIANLCAHYRWDLGVQGPAELSGENSAVTFVIAREPVTFPVVGRTVSNEFWTPGSTSEGRAPAFWFAEIPEGSDPERVLEGIGVLTSATSRAG